MPLAAMPSQQARAGVVKQAAAMNAAAPVTPATRREVIERGIHCLRPGAPRDSAADPLDSVRRMPRKPRAPLRYFVVTAGLTYSKNDYDNVAIIEHEWSPKLTAEYYVNREITLFGRYEHAAWRSDAPDGDYDVDDVRFGVRFRR